MTDTNKNYRNLPRDPSGRIKHKIKTLRKEIETLLGDGYSFAKIHEILTKEGKLDVGLRSFQRHAPKMKDKIDGNENTGSGAHAIKRQKSAPAKAVGTIGDRGALKRSEHNANPTKESIKWNS